MRDVFWPLCGGLVVIILIILMVGGHVARDNEIRRAKAACEVHEQTKDYLACMAPILAQEKKDQDDDDDAALISTTIMLSSAATVQ